MPCIESCPAATSTPTTSIPSPSPADLHLTPITGDSRNSSFALCDEDEEYSNGDEEESDGDEYGQPEAESKDPNEQIPSPLEEIPQSILPVSRKQDGSKVLREHKDRRCPFASLTMCRIEKFQFKFENDTIPRYGRHNLYIAALILG